MPSHFARNVAYAFLDRPNWSASLPIRGRKQKGLSSPIIEIYRELVKTDPSVYAPELARTLTNLGDLERRTQHFEQSEKEYNEALSIKRKFATADPGLRSSL